MDDVLVSALEVARQLDVDRSTVARWAQSGKLPIWSKGDSDTGAYMFRQSDVEAWRIERFGA